MNEGRIVFAQLLDFLPKYEFDKCVARYHGNHRVRKFPAYEQFLVLAFAQLTWRESLRDIDTLVGSIWSGLNVTGSYNPPLVSIYGTLLLSCYVPINSATFFDVVGRDPQNGESVTSLNASSQILNTTTFQNGSWNNGIPLLNVGQSAFFNLAAVPEPEVLSLFGAGAVLLMAHQLKRKR